MLNRKYRRKSIKSILLGTLVLLLISSSLVGCSDRLEGKEFVQNQVEVNQPSRLSEVAPPEIIQQLNTRLNKYQPQVQIISPEIDQIFTDTRVTVQVDVQDLPVFRDEELQLGPYLQLILDNNTYLSIYAPDEPITLPDLTPGTHTLRLFAVKPWGESFKNEGAYTQTKFHILTPTNTNPDSSMPLLTYNSPQGSYGAEPIMLDFYLTNAPLHLVAREDATDTISDWRIKVTINDESFLLDSWKPVYLKGFEPGVNWVKLEFLDDLGNRIDNQYNTTVRVVDYKPGNEDTLARLVTGDLDLETAQAIIDPDYQMVSSPSATEKAIAPETKEDTLPESTAPEIEEDLPESNPTEIEEDLPESNPTEIEEDLPQLPTVEENQAEIEAEESELQELEETLLPIELLES